MTDDLVFIRFILVLVQEILGAGESDLVDILVNLILCHTETVIFDPDRLFLRIYGNLDFIRFIVRGLILAHQSQFL